MGHSIQAIVARGEIVARIHAAYPELPFMRMKQGFALLPVNATFIDSVAEARPSQTTDEFMLLTDGFRDFLRELSALGTLAYIETEYRGGRGGQGAAVYSNGEVLMEPQWSEYGPINAALNILGVRRRFLSDRFSALGLGRFRFYEDLIVEAARQATIA